MRGRNDIFDTDIQKIGNFARNCIFEGDFLIFSPIRTRDPSQVAHLLFQKQVRVREPD